MTEDERKELVLKVLKEVDETLKEVTNKQLMQVFSCPYRVGDTQIFARVITEKEIITSNIKYMKYSN